MKNPPICSGVGSRRKAVANVVGLSYMPICFTPNQTSFIVEFGIRHGLLTDKAPVTVTSILLGLDRAESIKLTLVFKICVAGF